MNKNTLRGKTTQASDKATPRNASRSTRQRNASPAIDPAIPPESDILTHEQLCQLIRARRLMMGVVYQICLSYDHSELGKLHVKLKAVADELGHTIVDFAPVCVEEGGFAL